MSSSPESKKINDAEIGARLRTLRTSRNLSVRAFGKRYGFNHPLWNDYENGKRKPSAPTMDKICKLFDVSADWILFGERARNLDVANPERRIVRYVQQQADNATGETDTGSTKRDKKKNARHIPPGRD